MVKRKPILLVDESDDSKKAVDVFKKLGIHLRDVDENQLETSE